MRSIAALFAVKLGGDGAARGSCVALIELALLNPQRMKTLDPKAEYLVKNGKPTEKSAIVIESIRHRREAYR